MIAYMKLDLPAEPALVPVVRRQLDCLLQHLDVVEEDVYRAGIVITEGCSNVVRHAYDEPGQWYVAEFEYHPDRLVIRVTDHGRGFDLRSVSEPRPGQIGGYGLYFIREAADKMDVLSSGSNGARLIAELNMRYKSPEALELARKLDKTR